MLYRLAVSSLGMESDSSEAADGAMVEEEGEGVPVPQVEIVMFDICL